MPTETDRTNPEELVETLLPCPFCGASEEGFLAGKTGMPLVEELSEGGWRVTCYTCRYSICWEPYPTREAAIAAWNTRAAIDATPLHGDVRPTREHVMPGDPDHLMQTALQWWLNFDFGAPHSVRESNVAVEGFKDGYRAALAARGA